MTFNAPQASPVPAGARVWLLLLSADSAQALPASPPSIGKPKSMFSCCRCRGRLVTSLIGKPIRGPRECSRSRRTQACAMVPSCRQPLCMLGAAVHHPEGAGSSGGSRWGVGGHIIGGAGPKLGAPDINSGHPEAISGHFEAIYNHSETICCIHGYSEALCALLPLAFLIRFAVPPPNPIDHMGSMIQYTDLVYTGFSRNLTPVDNKN